jgi:hypothetical protein
VGRKNDQHSGVNQSSTGLPNSFTSANSRLSTPSHGAQCHPGGAEPHATQRNPESLRGRPHEAVDARGSDGLQGEHIIALQIIFDLHKNYRPDLEDEVQPFLDFVVKVSGIFMSFFQILVVLS